MLVVHLTRVHPCCCDVAKDGVIKGEISQKGPSQDDIVDKRQLILQYEHFSVQV